MSAQLQPISVGVQHTGETANQKRLANESASRWVWQSFKDISFMGPLGREIKNSIPPEIEVIHSQKTLVFCGMRRCNPYILQSHEYNVVAHEQEGNDLPASYGAWAPGVGLETRPIKTPKSPRKSADELRHIYGKEYGLIVLDPLTGIDDASVVEAIFMAVQPFAYALHNMDEELGMKAIERMRDLPDDLAAIAEGCRVLMLQGAQRALATAREQYGEYYKDTQKYVGSGQGRSFPLDHDRFIAEQLGVELPTVIKHVPQAQGESPAVVELLTKLTDSATQKNTDSTEMAERVARMEAERAEEKVAHERLTAQVDELIAAKTEPKVEKKAK